MAVSGFRDSGVALLVSAGILTGNQSQISRKVGSILKKSLIIYNDVLYCIWVIRNMTSRYQYSEEQIEEIEQARKDNKDKRAESRFGVAGKRGGSHEVSKATGFHAGSVKRLPASIKTAIIAM